MREHWFQDLNVLIPVPHHEPGRAQHPSGVLEERRRFPWLANSRQVGTQSRDFFEVDPEA